MIENDYHIEATDSLNADELASVSALYRKGIPRSLLARLRSPFFSKFLAFGLRDGLCSILVLRNNLTNGIDGFVLFSDHPGWIGKTVSRHRVPLLLEAMKNIVNRKLWEYAFCSIGARLKRTKHPKRLTADGNGNFHERAELFAITVSETIRKRGWGKSLFMAFENHVKSMGCREYFIMTLSSNDSSNLLYTRMGAVLVSTHQNPNGTVNEYRKFLGEAL